MVSIFYVIQLFIYSTYAIKYFGFTPSIAEYNTFESHASAFIDNDLEVLAVLRAENLTANYISDFLSFGSFYNVTLDSLTNENTISEYRNEKLTKRIPINYGCKNNVLVNNQLTSSQQTQICFGLAGLATGATAGIAYIIQSKACTAVTDGHATFCNIAVIITGTAASFVTGNEVNTYCPAFLNVFATNCQGAGMGNADNSNFKIVESTSQSGDSCGNYNVPCIETTI